MQRERGGRGDIFDAMNAFSGFGNFGGGVGSHRSRIPGFDLGRDPFDDPFFTQPFESIFHQPATRQPQQTNGSEKGIMIEEMCSDDEGRDGSEEIEGQARNPIVESSDEPHIQHPDEEDDDGDVRQERKSKNSVVGNEGKRPQSLPRNLSYQTCKVTYGGVNGAYYTSTKTRRTGSDGVVLEESKEADTTTGEATHKISRGIHNKGHSVTRKLNADGKVDTMQTLHNLVEDELSGFEKAWKDNNTGKLPIWRDSFGTDGSSSDTWTGDNMGGWMVPSLQSRIGGAPRVDNKTRGTTSGGNQKKVVRINID